MVLSRLSSWSLKKKIDHLIKLSMASYNVNHWVSVRIDALGTTFMASLTIYLVYYASINAVNTGFSLTMAIEFCSLILWSVQHITCLRFKPIGEIQNSSLTVQLK